MTEARNSVAQRIDALEEAYEFMLAYAARGAVGEEPADGGEGIRFFLGQAVAALTGLAERAGLEAGRLPSVAAGACREYIPVLGADAAKAMSAVHLVLAMPSIGSQLVDNLNASAHLRAVLADLFLLDEILKG